MLVLKSKPGGSEPLISQATEGMLARMLALYSVSTLPLGRLLVVMASEPAEFITIVNVFLADSWPDSAVISMLRVP